MELIRVSKQGEYLEVHLTALAAHKALGWKECAKQESAQEPAQDSEKVMSKADLQATLDEKGIAYKPAASKADLQALLNAEQIAQKD